MILAYEVTEIIVDNIRKYKAEQRVTNLLLASTDDSMIDSLIK